MLKNASLVISERVAEVVNDWEAEHGRVAGLQAEILGQFQKRVDVVDRQLKDIGRE